MKKIVQYLIITVLSGASLSSLYAVTIQEALDASNRKEYAISFMLSKQLCDERVGRACNLLATHYEDAQGVAKDTTKAMALYTQACELEEARGCENLGRMYASEESFKDTSKSNTFYQKGTLLYEKQCNSGTDAGACTNLGINYANGAGVPKDQAKANELYKKGCDGGSANACNNLGASYTHGTGVPKDQAKAYELIKKSCDGGSKEGCENLKILERQKQTTPPPSTKAPSPSSNQNSQSTMPATFVGIDDMTSFPSDYIGKNHLLRCKNAQVNEAKKDYTTSDMMNEANVEKQANAILNAMKAGGADAKANNDMMGKTVYQVGAECKTSDGRFTIWNPLRFEIYTSSKEVAKVIAKSDGQLISLTGKAKKGETQLTRNRVEFIVESAKLGE